MTTWTSTRALLAALGLASLTLAGCGGADDDHGHDHGPGADHAHESDDAHAHDEEDHGHAHEDGDDHHDHGTSASGPNLGFVIETPPAAGQSSTVSLILTGPNGQTLSPDDLAETHEHKLHVMIVDEGLEDYTHMHPEPGADGLYQITFTPAYARTYRVWADFTLAEGSDDDHHHEDDAHDHESDSEHDGHHGDGEGQVIVSEALIVGEDAAPALGAENILTAEAGGLNYALVPGSEVKAGETVEFTVSVSDADGAPFAALEPIMGAYAHLVGFDAGATNMVHAHPRGAHPHGASSRGGPDLFFAVTSEEAGPHRLFLQTMTGGSEDSVAFTLNVQP